MKKILLAGCIVCLLLSCQRFEKIILVEKDYLTGKVKTEMRRAKGTQKWAIYDAYNKIYLSDFVIDSFQPLGLDEVSGSENMFIMSENGKEYLYNANAQMFLFEKECYTLKKDEEGYAYAETESGIKYPLRNTYGLPKKCANFLRNNRCFLYTLDGKHCGLYYDEDDLYESKKYRQIFPDIYDRIIYIHNYLSISHFVVCKDGQWEILTMKGEPTKATKGFLGALEITNDFYGPNRECTQWYINLVRSIPLGIDNKYVPAMRTNCSHIGNKQMSVIIIKPVSKRQKSQDWTLHKYGIFE
ncbi:MAG: hypothetical protein IKM37_03645 [Alistipes sp.]|nr:hypothetical protein [Alistipes sp.]